ncbi:MAG: glycosyltransferase family 1 protein [Pedosphaera sp.]|nr:glycosyltransferase family 1 protein [Pedosphaera sp.]
MRVTHIITRLIVGGAQENTITSALGLYNLPEWRVDLVSGPGGSTEGSLEASLQSKPGLLTLIPELVRPVSPVTDFLALRRLTALLRDWRPEVVHTHSGKAGVLGRLAAHRAGVPVIVHTIHGPSFGSFQGPFANLAFRTAEKIAARVTTHFIAVADAMTRQYLAAGIGTPEKFTRIFSGFDLDPYLQAQRDPALAAKFGLQAGDFVVGKIARLFDLKGHEELIAIAPQLIEEVPRARFLFIGDGPWRQRFEDQVDAMGLARNFLFVGLIPPAEVARHVALLDVLVHLSRREGLPRAIPQAMAGGKPVIAYDCDGASEVCLDGETGFLLRPGDRLGLKDRLVQLARNSLLRERFGVCGREFVRSRFSADRMVRDLETLYRRLWDSRSDRRSAPNRLPPLDPAP